MDQGAYRHCIYCDADVETVAPQHSAHCPVATRVYPGDPDICCVACAQPVGEGYVPVPCDPADPSVVALHCLGCAAQMTVGGEVGSFWRLEPASDGENEQGTTTSLRRRATWLRVDQLRLLDQWCAVLRDSFQTPVYLVGSALRGPGWRDVDVRIVLPAARHAVIPMRLLDLNLALSLWGQRSTGLPIDCQVQSETEHRTHDGPANPRPSASHR